MTDSITRYVSDRGTAYVVRATVLKPSETPEVERVGYRSETVLWTVLGGSVPVTDHDRHRLVRRLDGSNDWLHDHLKAMRSELLSRR